ncbi:putative membrane protein [Streptomyces davaonensis JCM 4913]|uniref:Putative membrane protein n=1 Tax=Streptomyces davaonensis (strain DSM 101723 / JCM 4913 / KCC S-0913 / 768) TaxID=1214101 RepID=K4R807_STRDJ|nr:putative membrane protein [Streptomyces davaonensis JCM 4913]
MPLGRRDSGHRPCERPSLKTKRFNYPPLIHVDQATRSGLVQQRIERAPRGTSIIVGAAIGAVFFKERFGAPRIVAAALLVVGIGLMLRTG